MRVSVEIMGNTFGTYAEKSNDLLDEAQEAEANYDFKAAKMLYLDAMDYIEPGTEEMATCHDRLGCLLVRSGELVEALKSFKKALAIKKSACPDSSSTAKTLSNIAAVYCGKGEHEKAVSILEECLEIRERREPDSLKLAKTLSNMAVVLAHLDRYEEAIELHERVFQIKKLLAPGTVSMATTCVNLANLCMRTDPSRSVFYLKRAKLIAEITRPVPYGVLSDVFTVTGHILRHADFFQDAVEMYDQAILFEKYAMPKSPKIATLLQEIEATRTDAEGLEESSKPLSEEITETAKRLRHLVASPNLPKPTKAASSLHAPTPPYSLDNMHSFTSLAPPVYGNTHYAPGVFQVAGEALPYPPSLDSEIDYPPADAASGAFLLQSLPSLPEGKSYESPSSPYAVRATDCDKSPETVPATKVTHASTQESISAKKNGDKRGGDHRPRSLSTVRRSGTRSNEYDAGMLDYLVKVSDARRLGSEEDSVQSSLQGSVFHETQHPTKQTTSKPDKKKRNPSKKKKTHKKNKQTEEKTERKDNEIRKEVKQEINEDSDDGIRLMQSMSVTSDMEERHPSAEDSWPPPMEYSRTNPDDQPQPTSPCPSDEREKCPMESIRPLPPCNDGEQPLSPKSNRKEKFIRRFRSILKTPPRARPEPRGYVAPLEPKGYMGGSFSIATHNDF